LRREEKKYREVDLQTPGTRTVKNKAAKLGKVAGGRGTLGKKAQ